MTQVSTGHVFLSYSRRDELLMRRIVLFLRGKGLKVWVDNEGLVPGTPIWVAEIEKAIKGASAVVVILSPDSKNSAWVNREISCAELHNKRIFPVLARGDKHLSIPLLLITCQYVDMRQNERAGIHSLSVALLHYLEELEASERAASVPPMPRPTSLPEAIKPSRPTLLPEEIRLHGKPRDLPK